MLLEILCTCGEKDQQPLLETQDSNMMVASTTSVTLGGEGRKHQRRRFGKERDCRRSSLARINVCLPNLATKNGKGMGEMEEARFYKPPYPPDPCQLKQKRQGLEILYMDVDM